MKILYLDTSSSFLYTALVADDKLLFQIKENLGKDMSKYVLSKIEKEFNRLKISPEVVEKIILVSGPGSFTGIRIGATIAKIIAWTKNIPIITISSLEAMAVSCIEKSKYYVPLIDARRGFVFAEIFDENYNSVLEAQYINLNELVNYMRKLSDDVTYTTNDSLEIEHVLYNPDILKIVNFFKKKNPTNPHLVDALYLKATEAEEKKNDY